MNRMEMKAKDPKKLEKGELKHTPLITVKGKDDKGYTFVESYCRTRWYHAPKYSRPLDRLH